MPAVPFPNPPPHRRSCVVVFFENENQPRSAHRVSSCFSASFSSFAFLSALAARPLSLLGGPLPAPFVVCIGRRKANRVRSAVQEGPRQTTLFRSSKFGRKKTSAAVAPPPRQGRHAALLHSSARILLCLASPLPKTAARAGPKAMPSASVILSGNTQRRRPVGRPRAVPGIRVHADGTRERTLPRMEPANCPIINCGSLIGSVPGCASPRPCY